MFASDEHSRVYGNKELGTPNQVRPRLLLDKLAPPFVPLAIPRPRLLEALTRSMYEYKATLVSGRAGTGKTTLMADFARQLRRDVAWFRVESAECEQDAFLLYLAASINLHRPGFNAILAQAHGSDTVRTHSAAEEFIYELSLLREPLLVIIEDLHLTDDAAWVAPFFQRLLLLLPEGVHMIITTRGNLPTNFARLRSKQMLNLVDEPALAFTMEEARQLFIRYGKSETEALNIWQKTRGRVGAMTAQVCQLPEEPVFFELRPGMRVQSNI